MNSCFTNDGRGLSEWDRGSLFDKFTFRVALPMLGTGLTKPLQFDDLMNISERDKVGGLLNDLKLSYSKAKSMYGIPRVFVALCYAHWNTLIICGIYTVAEGAVRVISPIVLSYLLSSLASEDESIGITYMYAIILGLLSIFQAIVHHILYFYTMRMGWNWKSATTALIYDRLFYLKGSLSGSNGKNEGTSTGKLVNLISSDVQRLEEFAIMVCFLWESWLEVGAILAILITRLGVLPAIAGVGMNILFIPIQILFAKRFAMIRGQTAGQTDKRVRHISEVIEGISSVKSFCWEFPFYELISSFRNGEVNAIRKSQQIKALNNGLYYALPPLTTFIIFLVYNAQGKELTLPLVFSTLALVNVLKAVVGRNWTQSLERASETMASCGRIDAYLVLTDDAIENESTSMNKPKGIVTSDEAVDTAHIELTSPSANNKESLDSSIDSISKVLFQFKSPVSFAYDTSARNATASSPGVDTALLHRPSSTSPVPKNVTLKNLQFSVSRGELVMVVGSVGAGKSSLLLSILNEIPPMNAVIDTESRNFSGCRVAYCAQRPWIMAATVRENIVLAASQPILTKSPASTTRVSNESSDLGPILGLEHYYATAMESCCIVDDLDNWTAHDSTEIGERGISVSGGQKARIALARAVCSNADMMLLDDPLSAVDAHVGKALFFECIMNQLVRQDKGVVLVTHQLQYLPYAHKVLVLSESGEQLFFDTYDQLLVRAHDFPQLGLLTSTSSGSSTPPPSSDEVHHPSGSNETTALGSYAQTGGYAVKKFVPKVAEPGDEDYEKRRIIVQLEDRATGAIGSEIYWKYLKSGGLVQGLFALFMAVVAQVLLMVTEYWVKWWANEQFGHDQDTPSYRWIYAILVATCIVMGFGRALMWFRFTLNASSSLHDNALWAVVRSPMTFFVANPTGRILNRFAADQNLVDELFAATSFDLVQTFLFCLGALALACITIPYIVIMVPFLLWAFYVLRFRYISSSREIKRMMAVLKSPVVAMFSASLDGVVTLRAYELRPVVTRQFHTAVDRLGRAWFSFLMVSRWLGFRLDLLSASVVTATAVLAVVLRKQVDIGLLGFALVYTLGLSGLFQWTVRQSAEVEAQMTSVERLSNYTELPPESGYGHQGKYLPKSKLIQDAAASRISSLSKRIMNSHLDNVLQIKDLVVTYRNDLAPVLRGLSLTIPCGAKVGICGRTGCGKSSLLLALLRLNIITSGDISITSHVKSDGNSTNELKQSGEVSDSLNELSLVHGVDIETTRSLVAVIPQDPHLFGGTLRYNLDPFNQYTDHEIWNALEDAHIKSFLLEIHATDQLNDNDIDGSVAVTALNMMVEEHGNNFSAGQRQLLSLARAILRRSPVILMDEVSASVDFKTDKLIQETIRTSSALKHATIITIAHRLRTIADCDLIAVIHQGVVFEQGTPFELLSISNQGDLADNNEHSAHSHSDHESIPSITKTDKSSYGIFKQLAEQSGEYEDIFQLAHAAHHKSKDI